MIGHNINDASSEDLIQVELISAGKLGVHLIDFF